MMYSYGLLNEQLSGSARVFGYTVYRGFLNRDTVYCSLNTGIRYITFFEFQVLSIPGNIFGYIWMNFGYFGLFWRIFFGYTGIPLYTPQWPTLNYHDFVDELSFHQ